MPMAPQRVALTLGPILFNWPAEQKVDFYARIADEAPVDVVYVGEVVCSKRAPFFEDRLPEVIERLHAGGKTVVLSTLALIMTRREIDWVRDVAGTPEVMVEANDVAAIRRLQGRPHVIGPFVNVYNEGTLRYLVGNGARRVVLPAELGAAAQTALVQAALAQAVPAVPGGASVDGRPCGEAPVGETRVEIEAQVFGRLPLALSSRCYHARSHGLHKDGCQYVCAEDPDGLAVETLEHQPFLAINGTQTLSHTVCNLIRDMDGLRRIGMSHLRLWPHAIDMVRVAHAFRDVLDGRQEAEAAAAQLDEALEIAPFSNGYYHEREGYRFSPAVETD